MTPVIELKISMNQQGQIQVSGPLENKIACYGLLEAAKETIAAFHAKKASGPTIVPASADTLQKLGN